MVSLLRLGLVFALVAALVGATPAAPAYAQTITVTTTAEAPGGSGDCTLGEAIDAANTNAAVDGCAAGTSSDVIVLQAGATYTLTTGQATGYGPTAFIISTTVTIQGNGATLNHQPLSTNLRFFVLVAPGDLTLIDLTLKNGRARGADGPDGTSLGVPGADGGDANGGAIFGLSGALTLNGVSFVSNLARGGDGGDGFFVSSVSGSDGGDGGLAQGGAVLSAGPVTIIGAGATFVDNEAHGGLGGAHGATNLRGTGKGGDAYAGALYGTPAGLSISAPLTMIDNRVTAGAGPGGGGLALGGALTLEPGTTSALVGAYFESNIARGGNVTTHPSAQILQAGWGEGGAIYNLGYLTLRNSRVVSNTAQGGNGPSGGEGVGGGLLIGEAGTLSLDHTDLLSNTAQGGIGFRAAGLPGPAGGGGAYISFSSAQIEAAAIVGNVAISGTNALTTTPVLALGGGLILDQSAVVITNTTLAHNVAGYGAGLYNADFGVTQTITLTHVTVYSNTALVNGGGLVGAAQIVLRNSLVASNAPDNCQGTITVQGDNLQYPGGGCGGATQVNPLLGTLGNHGGGTLTVNLLAASPAINLADPTYCPATDQREVPRPLGSACDLGAFEYGGLLYLPLLRR